VQQQVGDAAREPFARRGVVHVYADEGGHRGRFGRRGRGATRAVSSLPACDPARTVRTEDRAQPPTATDAPTCVAAPGATAAQDSCLGNAGAPADSGGRNVLGGPLQRCPSAHQTGFYRDGFCNTGADDAGVHVVCARVTDDFLTYSRSQGNDLVTPRGGFPGLKAGDGWCLCAGRWREAFDVGVAPPVVLEATHEAALRVASVTQLSGQP